MPLYFFDVGETHDIFFMIQNEKRHSPKFGKCLESHTQGNCTQHSFAQCDSRNSPDLSEKFP